MPYSSTLAATLSGASLRQLQYWRTGNHPLFVPELPKAHGQVRYSFRDVVALRSFVYLREDISLQRIRKAVSTLRELGNSEHLSRYTLVRVGRSVVLLDPDPDADVALDLVERPHAQRFVATLGDIFRPFRNQRGDLVVDLFRPREHVVVDPTVRGGFPVVDGTRVDYDVVASLVGDGVDPAEISEFYPSVSALAAADAKDFADEVDRYRSGELGAA